MSSKYGFLCFLALALVLLLMIKNYEIWTQPVEWVPEESTAKKPLVKPEGKSEVLSTPGPQKNPTSVRSYASIAEKNIFSPDRKDFPAPAAAGGRQLVRPQIVLYGVTIIGNYKAASIANPGRPLQKGERETFTVKKGERVGDYKLAEIFSDRVTLETEGDTFEVLLYDQSKTKKRSDIRTEIKPATVTSTQPVPSTPVPGSPIPTPTPAPTSTPAPTLPGPDYPRRRPSFPPSVPTPSTVVPQPTSPAGMGQGTVTTSSPGNPVSPALPPQKTEGN